MKKTLEVVGAIIVDNAKILAVKRGANKNPKVAYKYEFAGGKVEAGESKEQALVRELKEELSCDIRVINEFCDVLHEYDDVFVHLTVFICKALSGFELKEHIDYRWLGNDELYSVEWAEADYVIIRSLENSSEWQKI